MIRLIVSLTFVLSALSLLLAGCDVMEQAQNAAQRQQLMNHLKQLGLAYHQCHDQMQRGPLNWQEAVQSGLPAESRTAIESAGYTVHWGIKIRDAMGGTSNFILAYPPNAASEGGTILKLDGAVQQLTAQEFNDALAQQKIDSPKAMEAAAANAGGGSGASAAGAGSADGTGIATPSGGAGPPGPPAAPSK
jgi:hypothetical protein